MMRPLVYEWPRESRSPVEDEFLLGCVILVAPLLEKIRSQEKSICWKANGTPFYGEMLSWLPDNFYDGRYEIPGFIRSGYAVPLRTPIAWILFGKAGFSES